MPLFSKKSASSDDTKSSKKDLAIAYGVKKKARAPQPRMAEAKPEAVHAADLMEDEERAGSIAEAIMRKRREKSIEEEGGTVDLEANDEEGPASLDELNVETALKSGEKAPMLKENYKGRETILESIRKKMREKKGL